MAFIKIKGLPCYHFAHQFGAEEYHYCIPPAKNRIEVTVVTEGRMHLTHDGRKYVAERGDIICNLHTHPMQVDCPAYHMHRTAGFYMEFDVLEEDGEGALLLPLLTHPYEGAVNCHHILGEIARAHFQIPENSVYTAGFFLQILGEIDRINRTEGKCTPSDVHYVQAVKRYIAEHLNAPIVQREIAEGLGITPEYLCAVFKRCEGCTLIRYANERKLAGIRSLMENAHVSLQEAAFQYGFSDPNYVSKLYRRYFHTTITSAIKPLHPPIPQESEE